MVFMVCLAQAHGCLTISLTSFSIVYTTVCTETRIIKVCASQCMCLHKIHHKLHHKIADCVHFSTLRYINNVKVVRIAC